ncbi:MAG TPA: hypothetical protein VH475_13930 [Tepidisphaeraceae bacterium]|jgi:hypothetical protein
MLTFRNALVVLVGVMVASAWAGTARAADKDATGTWKWTMPGRNGNPGREVSLKLKQDGEKLTGTLGGGQNETEIKDGKIKDGELSFSVTRKRQDQEFTTKYSGKLDGDTIKGKTEFDRNGQTQSRDWEAKRAKE